MTSEKYSFEKINGTLLILNHFPKLKTAERELVLRLSAAAEELGWVSKTLNVSNKLTYKKLLNAEKDVDLVLDIHYEYPKFLSPKSLGAFWTPTYFMKFWDFGYVWENQLSHDQIIYSGSKKIETLVKQYRSDSGLATLNHSLPGSWIQWINTIERNHNLDVFYSGINWDRLSGGNGRHFEFFKQLDGRGILSIFGPKRLGTIRPWSGYQDYKGEIRFDGKALLQQARKSGVSLVISSEQHLREEIMSNRFFEGLAAGNVIVSDDSAFVRQHLGDRAFYLDFNKGDSYAAEQLVEIVEYLRSNPHELAERQNYSQDYFAHNFDLTKQMSEILVLPKPIKVIPDFAALIVGSSDTNLRRKISNMGFSRIVQCKPELSDFEDLLLLAKIHGLRKFVVFQGLSEPLICLPERINRLVLMLSERKIGCALLATVALYQSKGLFSPVLLSKTVSGVISLNGLIVNLDNLTSNLFQDIVVDYVPSLRIQSPQHLAYLNPRLDSYSLLYQLGAEFKPFAGSLRTNFNKSKLNESTTSRGAEEIFWLPKARKRLLLYQLISAAPGIGVLTPIIKWFLRIVPRRK